MKTTKTSRLLSIIGSVVAVIVVTAGIALAQTFSFPGVGSVDVEETESGYEVTVWNRSPEKAATGLAASVTVT